MADKKKSKEKKAKALSDKEVFELAVEHEQALAKEKKFKGRKEKIKNILVAELQRRKTKGLTSAATGTTVTFVQAEKLVYDGEGLWSDLKPVQRREVYEERIDLNALSPEARKAVIEALPKEERKNVTSHVLVVDKLSDAVQAGRIDAKVVAKHSEIQRNAPYISVSLGDGDK